MPSVSPIGPGAMPHDANAEAAPLDGEVLRHRVDAGLRGRRVNLQRRAVIVERRADVEHEAVAARLQRLERGARRVERAEQIDVDHRRESRSATAPRRARGSCRRRR